jgi:signal transduction histidine kinase
MYAVGFYTQYYRYRRVSTATERQQTKWVVYGLALWLAYMLLSSIPYYYLESLPPDAPVPWWGSLSVLGWFLSLSIVPICLTIAVTRYRLWDIDILINRTLVYGVLTAVTIGLYALVVGSLATLFQTQANWLVALVATGLVAVLFQPLRDRLQSRVNRLFYGHRDEPLEVLARLGQQLEDALPPEQLLPTLVETIAQTLKLPYAAITMALHKGPEIAEQTAAAYGKPPAQAQTYPLVYQGATIGHLHVAPRAAEETFTPAEERLLRNIARQAGTAVHALQLTADLQQARQQIVTSREEERRRLRRDLHDGLGPSLAATLLKIGSARALLASQPETTDKLLAEMETDIETTLADVRRIVYDLRPPALDQFGLIGALRAYAETCASDTLTVCLDAPDPLPPLPAAVEVAAYHIGREGLTNVVRHARAHHCKLKLWLENGRLHLTLQDDGQGFAGGAQSGVGLAAMRERAVELGGSCTIVGERGKGVQVTAVLPLPTQ